MDLNGFLPMGSMIMGLVVKSNELIRASYTLGLVEQRIVLMSIVAARHISEITPDTLCHIRANDYADLYDLTPQTAYEALKGASEVMFNRRVTIQVYDEVLKKTVPLTVRWLSGINYLDKEGLVTVRFSKDLIDHITDVYENFTRYKIENIAKLSSQYAIRLYELLVSWLSAGKTPIFELGEFRSQLGLQPSEYERIQHFKERVLDNAIDQINANTDITVTHEQHKKGRVIAGFSFTIRPKKSKAIAKSATNKKPKEQQIDWVGTNKPTPSDDVLKVAADFASLNNDQQKLILTTVSNELSGLKRSQFDVELSVYNATKSPSIFQKYKEYFARGLASLGYL